MIRAVSIMVITGLVALPLRAEVAALARASQAIALCWNTSALSREAQMQAITVSFRVDAKNRPLSESIALIGPSDPVAQEAFGAARRAILRCGQTGLPLPTDFVGHEIEIAFDPGTSAQ